MLRWRLLLGTLLIAGLVALFWLDLRAARPGNLLFPLAVFVAFLATGEMMRLTQVRTQRPASWAVWCGTLLVVLAAGLPHYGSAGAAELTLLALGCMMLALAVAVLLVAAAEIARYDRTEGVVVNLALALFVVVYVGVLTGFLVQLRFVGGPACRGLPLISLLVVVKMSDIGAYAVGRLFGRRKLAPRLSPGKTWEGLAGGLLFACASSWLVFTVLAPQMTVRWAVSPGAGWILSYGLLLGTAGVLGDLLESMIKRDGGFKDSSSWLPGFGGVLDLLDSLLLAAPVAYLMWIIL